MKIWQKRVVGVLTLGGSFLGMAMAVPLLAGSQPLVAYVLTTAFILLYAWGVWCGLMILEGAPHSARIASIFWALQIPYFMSPVAGYLFTSGTMVIASYTFNAGWGISWRFGSQFQYSLLQGDKPFVIGVNLFAVAIFIFLGIAAKKGRI